MSISTKTGDNGQTTLWSGERIKKNSPRVEAYGSIDELNSSLAEAYHLAKPDKIKPLLIEIQNDLFRVTGDLASRSDFKYPITEADVDRVTSYVHDFEKEVPLSGFVIPGSTPPSAKLDTCRTIARRAERRILSLAENEDVPSPVIKYINRLSDLLYMMARFEEKTENKLTFKSW